MPYNMIRPNTKEEKEETRYPIELTHMASSLKNILEPGEPPIWKTGERDGDEPYYCFSIMHLYNDLFTKTEGKVLVETDNAPTDPRGVVYYLLPMDEFLGEHLSTWKNKNGEQRTIVEPEHSSNDDYKGFTGFAPNNNKIIDFLHHVFSKDCKGFILKVQKHIIDKMPANLFGNTDLINYLSAVGNNRIVPAKESRTANEAFNSFLKKGDNESIAIVIANFFISAILGLRSMQYTIYRKDHYAEPHKKTYLLNGFGMELIWRPDLITTSYEKLQGIKQLYSIGEYKEVVPQVEAWLDEENNTASQNSTHATQNDFATAYEMLGDCFYFHAEEYNPSAKKNKNLCASLQNKGVEYWEKCEKTGVASSDVYFHLYEVYKDKSADALEEESREEFREKADKCLQIAFEKNNVQAVIRCAELGDGVSKDQLYEKLNYIIDNRANYAKNEVGKCLYQRSKLYSADGNQKAADDDMESAAIFGHEKARQQISRKKRAEHQTYPEFTENPNDPCCFVNSTTGNNLAFISSMPSGKWSLYTTSPASAPGIKAQYVCDIDTFITSQKIGGDDFLRPRIVFLFMSEDEQKNLNECLWLLDKLFNIALNDINANLEENKKRMIDSIDIYVGAEYETASMLIDASINDMGSDIYFKVHIADETRDCVHQLLCDAPLFTPRFNKGENASNVVLFGCSETNYRFIKESMASSYLGEKNPVTVTMLGSDAKRLECKLSQECPGLYPEPQTACIKPEFISCNITETDFPSYIYGKMHDENPDDPIVKVLSGGNYFVVDFADDYSNIKFAMALRTWLLRSRGTFRRVPFIAVKCKDRQNSYLAKHLTLSGQPAGESYYSKYDLVPFGIAGEVYSYSRLIGEPRLEQTALNIHKSYYGDYQEQAENDYYSFSYNADSSLLMAIGLSCRMFAAGVYFDRREDYLDFGVFNSDRLINKYKTYLEYCKENLEESAKLEQSRWNGFMLSRGWECASNAQLQAYGKQSTGSSHKHTLAKLHPFIREWDDLTDDELRKPLGILKAEFQYEKDPRNTTRHSVQDTEKFLQKPKKGEWED